MGVSLRAWRTGVGVDKCQPPRPLVGRARTHARIHWPTWSVQISNFKLKFQYFQYYGSSSGYLLRLMFVYTTSDIYLTLRNFQT